MPKLERQIRKKRVKSLPDIVVFFERMKDKDESANPLKRLEENELYFLKLVIWTETKEEFYLPARIFKPIRHKKVYRTAKTIRWSIFCGEFIIFLELCLML